MKNYSVLNISVNDEKIFINLDKFHKLEDTNFDLEPKEALIPFFDNVKMDISNSTIFKAIYFKKGLVDEHSEEHSYKLTSFTYELPTDPLLVLYVVSVFDHLTNCHFTKKSVKENIDENGNLTKSLLKFLGQSFYMSMWAEEEGEHPLVINKKIFENNHKFFHAIVNLSFIPEIYKIAIEKIKYFYEFCAFENIPLVDCLNNARVSELISNNKNPYLLLDNKVHPSQQRAIFDEIKNDLLQSKHSSLWEKIINHIYEAKLYDLCAPSIKQLTYKGENYNWRYTEIQFLKNMSVNLTLKNDRIFIINLYKNEAYCKHYAPGCRLHSIFKEELEAVGKYLGLEFDECNFHDEIVLTKNCSDRLFENGFGYLIQLNDLVNNLKKSYANNKNTLFSVPVSHAKSDEEELNLTTTSTSSFKFCSVL